MADTMEDTEHKFPIYMICSGKSLTGIKTFITTFVENPDQMGPLRVERYNRKETTRSILLLAHEVYEYILSEGCGTTKKGDDLIIFPYKLRKNNYPRRNNGETNNLFIPLPKELSSDECQNNINKLIESLVKFGIINEGDCEVRIPLQSRITGQHKKACFILFNKSCELDNIAVAKAVIHDSIWYPSKDNPNTKDPIIVPCFWSSHDYKKKGSNSSRKISTGLPLPSMDASGPISRDIPSSGGASAGDAGRMLMKRKDEVKDGSINCPVCTEHGDPSDPVHSNDTPCPLEGIKGIDTPVESPESPEPLKEVVVDTETTDAVETKEDPVVDDESPVEVPTDTQ